MQEYPSATSKISIPKPQNPGKNPIFGLFYSWNPQKSSSPPLFRWFPPSMQNTENALIHAFWMPLKWILGHTGHFFTTLPDCKKWCFFNYNWNHLLRLSNAYYAQSLIRILERMCNLRISISLVSKPYKQVSALWNKVIHGHANIS